MKKLLLLFLMMSAFAAYSAGEGDVQVDKSLKNSITKDYDQDGIYPSYEKSLRKVQGSVYVILPGKENTYY